MASGPWFPEDPSGIMYPPLPETPMRFQADVSSDGGLLASVDGLSVNLRSGYGPGPPHMVLFMLSGTTLLIRADGRAAGTVSAGQAPIAPLDYQPFYIGDWDFDFWGFAGTVGEVVVIKGAAANGTVSALEGYLKTKYGL
jgi:hypothetical protein